MEKGTMDVVVRRVETGLSMIDDYEVRLGPCPWTSDTLMWRITRPVSRKRAAELVEELLVFLENKEAFILPSEFNITGRLEPVSK